MKSLFIIRHAKSAWGSFDLPDFDRPLNDRGKKDAPEMARRLLNKNVKIDFFVSSPAKRARKTCQAFCEVFNYPKENILLIDELYHAPKEIFYEVVKSLENQYNSVAIFSHNPGITHFVNSLIDKVQIDNMPTCGVFAVSSSCQLWATFFENSINMISFDAPKIN